MGRWVVHDEVLWAREVVMEARGGWWPLSLLSSGDGGLFTFISLPTSLSGIGNRTDYAAGLMSADLGFDMRGMDRRVRERSRISA